MSITASETLAANTVTVDAEPKKASEVLTENSVVVSEGGSSSSVTQTSLSVTVTDTAAKSVTQEGLSGLILTQKVDVAPPNEWTPALTTTKLWLDADDATTITNVGSNTLQWDDKSTNDFHATQGAESEQPDTGLDTQNSKNVLRFSGVEWMTTGDVNLSSQPTTIFTVAKVRATGLSGRNYVFDGAEGFNQYRNLFALDGPNNDRPSIWAGTWGSHSNSTDANYHVFECHYEGNSSVIGIDADRETVAASTNGNLTKGINIGTNYTDSADFLDGNIAEIVLIDGTPTTDIRQKIEGYLAWKWGLQANLPSDHPYKNAAPTVLD
jgi:hypothetical protein